VEEPPRPETSHEQVWLAYIAVKQLFVDAQSRPEPWRAPLVQPHFKIQWATILSETREQIYVGFASPEQTDESLDLAQRRSHYLLVRQRTVPLDDPYIAAQFDFYENMVLTAEPFRGSKLVHPEKTPEAWVHMQNLLHDAQIALLESQG
jgi:hypothetical protein